METARSQEAWPLELTQNDLWHILLAKSSSRPTQIQWASSLGLGGWSLHNIPAPLYLLPPPFFECLHCCHCQQSRTGPWVSLCLVFSVLSVSERKCWLSLSFHSVSSLKHPRKEFKDPVKFHLSSVNSREAKPLWAQISPRCSAFPRGKRLG